MTVFHHIYKRRLLQLLQFLPSARRDEVVSQILADTSEWDAFRLSLPRALFPFFYSRQEREEINRKFAELLPQNLDRL